MEREPVSSSTILSIGYEFGSQTLEVEFKHGGIYQYDNVPETVYQQFMDSTSKGSFITRTYGMRFPILACEVCVQL